MSNTLDVCQTGYDYERYQLNELENENMKLKKKLDIAVKALNVYKMDYYISEYGGRSVMSHSHIARQALKEMEEVK